ncbi:MAG TPA: alpha/beta fold hydrolase [Actinomycetota bacterium]|nr:alpha/beta fold hydrolase [Actinomycetota bacterium]
MRTPKRRTVVVVLAALCSIIASCDADEPLGSDAGSEEITFPASDGVTLSGRLFGPDDGSAGVVLAHMFPSDQRAWFAFAERLGQRGYRVLTFNFRGYCPGGDAGCSEGEKTISAIWQDVEGAVAALRDEGATRIGLVGASMGGTASLVAASKEGQDIDALVTLSAPIGFEGLEASREILAQVTAAKLFLAGHEDTTAAEAVDTLYAETLQPKRPMILTTGDHGTDILSGNQAGIASTEIIKWLERYLPVDA